jgi:hypothetical protein
MKRPENHALGAGLLTPPLRRLEVSRRGEEEETFGQVDGGVRRPAPSA